MTHSLHGAHLIAGQKIVSDQTFASSPAQGPAQRFSAATVAQVAQACEAAEQAFWSFSATDPQDRANLLDTIAEEIDARGAALTEIGVQETGLPEARLVGERGRTTGQLRLFAAHIRDRAFLDLRHDPALPDRQPMARPDLRMIQRPVGPVAVFGASNFPLAFSVGGGDTAAALAAGCPVVVRGHTAHPGTGELVGDAIVAALARCGMAPGVFSLIQGGDHTIGAALVTHPAIKAVGFTGSLRGGRALFNLCAARPTPIPFFGELGSVNPMFLLPQALATRAEELAKGWAASLTMGAGQFCTNPGVAMVIQGTDADRFASAAAAALATVGPQTMLTGPMAGAFRSGRDHLAAAAGVHPLLVADCQDRTAAPCLLETTGEAWFANPELGHEVFGPLGLIVRLQDQDQMLAAARALEGQLTCTLHLDNADTALGQALLPILEHRAGRVLANGFPTGVEVADSMVHGGPYPASTNFGATSVGTLSIRRFLRPVCYQNIPKALLPAALR